MTKRGQNCVCGDHTRVVSLLENIVIVSFDRHRGNNGPKSVFGALSDNLQARKNKKKKQEEKRKIKVEVGKKTQP